MAQQHEQHRGEDLFPADVKRYGWGVRHVQMACMWVCMTALFVARGSMGVAVLAMTDAARANDSQVQIYSWDKETQGVVLSSFFWGYMSMQIPAGLLAARLGGAPLLLAALLANAALCALVPVLAQIGGWHAVCAARVGMGLTQACLYPASHTLLGRWLPAHERTALAGIVYAGSMVGTVISMPLAGVLADTALGWQLIFYSMAALMLVTAALWAALAASSPGQHRLMSKPEREYIERDFSHTSDGPQRLRPPWLHFARSRAVWAIAVAHFGMCAAFVLFFVDMPTYLEHGLGISLKNSALLSALPYVGMWFGNMASSMVFERIANSGLLPVAACRKISNSIAFYGVSVGLVALSFLGPEQRQLAVVVLVVTLTLNGFLTAGFMMNHLDLSPNFAGVLLSCSNFLANSTSVVVPILTGVVLRSDPSDLSRWRVVFLSIAALVAVANTVYVMCSSFERQPWDNPEQQRALDADELKPVLHVEEAKEANWTEKEALGPR